MIAVPWIVSVAISSPIALGLNYTDRRAETPTLCTFYNSDFLIYSSMGSFYIPSIVMTVLYGRIYLVIRSRSRTGGGGGTGNGLSRSAPSQCGATSAWRPSAWSRAVESCSVAAVAMSRFVTPPAGPAALGIQSTAEAVATSCRKTSTDVQPASSVPPGGITAAPDRKPRLSSHVAEPTAPPVVLEGVAAAAVATDVKANDCCRRYSMTSSSGDSSAAEDGGVANSLLPTVPYPCSSTTTMVAGTPVNAEPADGGPIIITASFNAARRVSSDGNLCRRTSSATIDNAVALSRATFGDGLPISAADDSPIPPAGGRKQTVAFDDVAITRRTTGIATTSLMVPCGRRGDRRLASANSLGRCDGSACGAVGGGVSAVDDATVDRAGDQVTGGMAGSVQLATRFHFTSLRQLSNNNHRCRQLQHQQQSRTQNSESKLKRAARRERKATKTLAIVLGNVYCLRTSIIAS
jgi:hypothetical protein